LENGPGDLRGGEKIGGGEKKQRGLEAGGSDATCSLRVQGQKVVENPTKYRVTKKWKKKGT